MRAPVPGAAALSRAGTMFGPETFIVRIAEDAMAPRVRAGDYVWVDPDEPAAGGRIVALRAHGPGRARRWCGGPPSRAAGASRGRRTPAGCAFQ